MWFAPSTVGAGGPHQNTSRIQHKEVLCLEKKQTSLIYFLFSFTRYGGASSALGNQHDPKTARRATAQPLNGNAAPMQRKNSVKELSGFGAGRDYDI